MKHMKKITTDRITILSNLSKIYERYIYEDKKNIHMCLGLHAKKIRLGKQVYFFYFFYPFSSIQRACKTLKQKLLKFKYTQVIN